MQKRANELYISISSSFLDIHLPYISLRKTHPTRKTKFIVVTPANPAQSFHAKNIISTRQGFHGSIFFGSKMSHHYFYVI